MVLFSRGCRNNRHTPPLKNTGDKSTTPVESSPKCRNSCSVLNSAEWALLAMRTVWIALFCLIALAATLALKVLPSANADVPQGAGSSAPSDFSERFPTSALPLRAEGQTTGTSTQSDTLTKADSLEPSYEITSVKSVAIQPAETLAKLSDEPEKIISWHWHDPLDKPKAVPVQPSAKRKSANAIGTRQRIQRRDPM
jgi:hypothetical protein